MKWCTHTVYNMMQVATKNDVLFSIFFSCCYDVMKFYLFVGYWSLFP